MTISSNELLPWLNSTACLRLLVALGAIGAISAIILLDSFPAFFLLVAAQAYLLANRYKRACKQRALELELKDEQLYSQGLERPEGDSCPICTLPLPLPMNENSGFNVCCMKRICHGCDLAAEKTGMFDCPFCRTTAPGSNADALARIRARVNKKDPEAINSLGKDYCHGSLGLQRDMRRAVELWKEAAELGSIEAVHSLGVAYCRGDGVEKDKDKGAEYYRKAAMQGNVESRFQLGYYEERRGNYGRAVRHFLISAKMGDNKSIEIIKHAFTAGVATKEQYAQALRGYQYAVEEMKSPERDEAKKRRN